MMEYKSLSPNIGVRSVKDTVEFYTNTLNFQLITSVPEEENFVWAMVAVDSVTIMFQEITSLIEEYPAVDYSEKPSLNFYIKMKESKELYKKLQGTKYIVKELHKTFYGMDEFAIKDINGYILTFAEDNQ